MVKDRYERVEVTFNKYDEFEIELYKYLVKKSDKIGKAKFIKNIIRKEMLKDGK
ncbi:hypothetical protein [uncultured Clostridium sp.]|uniref:hypothetical protein n=1 Tax=uncultured Clostridium sp. TaxID=59620 RepID=UPI0027309BF8|nr:hypothetical protein [uncultured Clostridium sp.]